MLHHFLVLIMTFQQIFQHLVQLYNLEAGHPVKMAYRLTKKVLFPTNVERSNTQLADAALHESKISGLEHFADNGHPNFKHTAEFLRYIRRWFDIVNVKNAYLHSRLNDSNRKPITLEDKEGLEYLSNFGQWMINWHEWRGKSIKMLNDTMLAASHTSLGLVDLA